MTEKKLSPKHPWKARGIYPYRQGMSRLVLIYLASNLTEIASLSVRLLTNYMR